ncbi:catechol 2,3-dioxygenase-like lactoylglutathione lyase family enzyme [Lewinella aquimaris]|uniref:Catechol 2,3-dioxygenase-like lactoylglutathione lyase family enzyme n=1 Tax=Neolewinella aquimaris TaxID=1835722 RepID=A0A840DW65_9BACT|nr:VOC family protein [Neolewinella aquimaris]MBB4077414.1 catechol 2,3-dioxygenase-like lactoylglutathione lyase family enzyme [Neolewinella aquimaris]
MKQRIAQFALVVDDYDTAIAFYVDILGFDLLEDTELSPEKRWVRVRPRGTENGAAILLAKAKNEEELAAVGNQTGGRVFLFLETDDFDRDYQRLEKYDVTIVREKSVEEYGTVAVFADLYGNLWDLIQRPVGTT